MEPQRYWAQPLETSLAAFESTLNGLSSASAAERLEKTGPNSLKTKRRQTPLALFAVQFKSPIVIILIIATALSALLGEWVNAAIIGVIVVTSAALSFYQEYNAGDAAARLIASVQVTASVLRDGVAQPIPIEQVVPGDVLLLAAGSLIPADALVIEAVDLNVNQALLTGETFPVEKMPGVVTQDGLAARTNTVFKGTSVSNGCGTVLVVATGTATAFGQIAVRLELRPPETEFERGIRRLGSLLSEVMFVLVLSIFALNVYFQRPVLDSLLFSVALAVGLTPQLLPAIININLSKGSQRMAKDGVIVRRLNAIENFGSMDVLCTDKTGTLTLGVVKLNGAFDPTGQPSEAVLQMAAINARYQSGLDDPLDQAILESRTPEVADYGKVDEIPYDFVRKRLSVIYRHDGRVTMATKGALANVLAVCSSVQAGDSTQPLDEARRAEIQQCFASWSAQGYRVLGVGFRDVPAGPNVFFH